VAFGVRVGVVAAGLGHRLVPVLQPVHQLLDLRRLRGPDLLGQLRDRRVEIAAEGQVHHLEGLGMVLHHLGGELDVGVVEGPSRAAVLGPAPGQGGDEEGGGDEGAAECVGRHRRRV
jgi:hypothetical protein